MRGSGGHRTAGGTLRRVALGAGILAAVSFGVLASPRTVKADNDCVDQLLALPSLPSGLTLDGSRDITVAGSATLQNCSITGAIGDGNDGVILVTNTGTLSLHGVTVSGITGGLSPITNHGSLTVDKSSSITGNTTTGDGGAVFTDGTLTVDSSSLTGNSAAGNGGAVAVHGGSAAISNATISGNTATGGNGGGIETENGPTVSIAHSTLASNTASENGGAVENSGGTLCLDTVTLGGAKPADGNTSTTGGGGALSNTNGGTITGPKSCSGSGSADATRLTIENNTADTTGGGILNDNSTLSLTNSTISSNKATASTGYAYGGAGNGGGIANKNFASASLASTAVDGNSALGSPEVGGNGGGIDNEHCSTLALAAVSVSNNRAATNGGGMANQSISVVGAASPTCDFAPVGGYAHHAVPATHPNTAAAPPADEVLISGNTAGGSGGGIMNFGNNSVVNLSRSEITANHANAHIDCECSIGMGGGIDNEENGTLGLDSSTISNNTAAHTGGGIENQGPQATVGGTPGSITDSNADAPNLTISGNQAQYGGSAIDDQQGVVGLLNATVAGNNDGTAALVTQYTTLDSITLANSLVADNAPANCASLVTPSPGVTDNKYNLETGSTCGLSAASSQSNVADSSLQLLALGNFGGPTVGGNTDTSPLHTQALGAGSIAQGFVAGGCPPPASDERGMTRAANLCAAGATEGDIGLAFSPSTFDGNTDVTVTVTVNAAPPCPSDPVLVTWGGGSVPTAPWGATVTLHAAGNNCVAVIDPVPPTTTAGKYTVTGVDNACSCSGQTSVTLNALPPTSSTPPSSSNPSGGSTSLPAPTPAPTPGPSGGVLGAFVPPPPGPATPATPPATHPGGSSLSPIASPTLLWGATLSLPAAAFGATVQTGIILAAILLLMVLIPFPAELFNATYDENQDRIKGWWRSHFPWLAAIIQFFKDEEGRRGRAVALVLVLILGGVLGAALDPAFGWNLHTLSLSGSVALALILCAAASALAVVIYRRRKGEDLHFRVRALPGGLAITFVGVLLSRLLNFQPGYLYGLILVASFFELESADDEGKEVAASSLSLIVFSVAAWAIWIPVQAAATQPGAHGALIFLADMLTAIFVIGIVRAVILLVPMRFLPGLKLFKWNRLAWAAVFGVGAFAMAEIMLLPESGTYLRSVAPVATTLGLFFGFGLASFFFWGYFRYRRPPAGAVEGSGFDDSGMA